MQEFVITDAASGCVRQSAPLSVCMCIFPYTYGCLRLPVFLFACLHVFLYVDLHSCKVFCIGHTETCISAWNPNAVQVSRLTIRS